MASKKINPASLGFSDEAISTLQSEFQRFFPYFFEHCQSFFASKTINSPTLYSLVSSHSDVLLMDMVSLKSSDYTLFAQASPLFKSFVFFNGFSHWPHDESHPVDSFHGWLGWLKSFSDTFDRQSSFDQHVFLSNIQLWLANQVNERLDRSFLASHSFHQQIFQQKNSVPVLQYVIASLYPYAHSWVYRDLPQQKLGWFHPDFQNNFHPLMIKKNNTFELIENPSSRSLLSMMKDWLDQDLNGFLWTNPDWLLYVTKHPQYSLSFLEHLIETLSSRQSPMKCSSSSLGYPSWSHLFCQAFYLLPNYVWSLERPSEPVQQFVKTIKKLQHLGIHESHHPSFLQMESPYLLMIDVLSCKPNFNVFQYLIQTISIDWASYSNSSIFNRVMEQQWSAEEKKQTIDYLIQQDLFPSPPPPELLKSPMNDLYESWRDYQSLHQAVNLQSIDLSKVATVFHAFKNQPISDDLSSSKKTLISLKNNP